MIDFSLHQKVSDAKHWTADVNQLYHPTAEFNQDSEDIVYVCDTVSITKFLPILLKEWFFITAKDGYLIIDYKPNDLCDWDKLEKTMWWLWKKQYEIIFHGAVPEKDHLTVNSLREFIKETEDYNKKNIDKKTLLPEPVKVKKNPGQNEIIRFVCRKTSSTLLPHDSIEKWTFGIITNGKRLDWIEKIINSIRTQEIPHYKIIICGCYYDRKEEDIEYIPFNHRDELGWITKKKNLIVEASPYENICIIHDRLVFDGNWYSGIKKWGNCFEHLACVQNYNGESCMDWLLHEKLANSQFGFATELDHRDWDFDVYQSGQLHISKKTYLTEMPWNESCHWGEVEDLDITNRLRDEGYLLRFNPFSSFDVLVHRFGKVPRIPFDSKKLSKKRKGNFVRNLGRKTYKLVYRISFLKNILIKMSRIYK